MVIPVSSTITGRFTKSYAAEAFAFANVRDVKGLDLRDVEIESFDLHAKNGANFGSLSLVARDNNKAR